jgi:hypothetical protein
LTARASTLHWLADLLQLRRRRASAEQEDRYTCLHAALQPATNRDPGRAIRVDPNWVPTVGGVSSFRMTDFLTYARVDPASRGQ